MKGILRKRATLAALQLFAAQNREPKRLGLAHGVRAAVPSARDCGRNTLGENFSCLFLGGADYLFVSLISITKARWVKCSSDMNSRNGAVPMLLSMKVLSFAFFKKRWKNCGNTMFSLMATQRHSEQFIAVPSAAILTCSACVSQKAWNEYFMVLSNNCLEQPLERFTGLEIFFDRPDKHFVDWELESARVRKAFCINGNVPAMFCYVIYYYLISLVILWDPFMWQSLLISQRSSV